MTKLPKNHQPHEYNQPINESINKKGGELSIDSLIG